MTRPTAAFAVLTPPGAAAVATVGIVGPGAWDILRGSFRPAGSRPLPATPESDRFWFGQFGGPPGDAVIVSARHERSVEIHCHGGPEVVRMVTDELARNGAEPKSSADFLGADSSRSTQAEIELSRAPTLRTAAILLDQFHGAFADALAVIDAALTADLPLARTLIATLRGRSGLGRHLTQPWRVALAGAPNVGKSSLANALVGFQRSVVTPIPGTTRDVVTTAIAIDGWPVELIDTAGQRDTTDDLENQGIGRGRAAANAADLCLWIMDATARPDLPNGDVSKVLLVINKSDLPPAWDLSAIADASVVSAQTGAGLPELCERIGQRLVPDPPSPGAAVPFSAELADKVSLIERAVAMGNIDLARTTIEAARQSL